MGFAWRLFNGTADCSVAKRNVVVLTSHFVAVEEYFSDPLSASTVQQEWNSKLYPIVAISWISYVNLVTGFVQLALPAAVCHFTQS
jgi:hypothetical protein